MLLTQRHLASDGSHASLSSPNHALLLYKYYCAEALFFTQKQSQCMHAYGSYMQI